MKIPKSIKVLAIIGIIVYGCFESLLLFNRYYATEGGKYFIKTHKSTVKSIDCSVPAFSFALIDQSIRFCTFKATPEQIKVLVKNLDFCPINPVMPSDKELAKNYGVCLRPSLDKVEANLENLLIDYDELRSSSVEKHICWNALGLSNRSELELYGAYANKESKYNTTFYLFYKKSTRDGCVRFRTMDGKIS
jgi:hypothetical protein